MVEPSADNIDRPVTYAKWRTDQAAREGHSQELISIDVKPADYDKIGPNFPLKDNVNDTLLKQFRKHLKSKPGAPFLGTRYLAKKQPTPKPAEETKDGKPPAKVDPVFGPYEWQTYEEVDRMSENAARAIRKMEFCPVVIGEEKEQRFLGIWAKNSANWMISLLAGMKTRSSVVGFYDAMGNEAVDYILKQTELSTIFGTVDYVKKIV